MTTPEERTRAVVELGREVSDLAQYLHGRSETVRVPRETIRRLFGWLRHYPTKSDMSALSVDASVKSHCACSLRTRLVGDGCQVCNPEYADELARPAP